MIVWGGRGDDSTLGDGVRLRGYCTVYLPYCMKQQELIKPKKVLSIPEATFKPAHRRKTDKTYRGLISITFVRRQAIGQRSEKASVDGGRRSRSARKHLCWLLGTSVLE
jgi:hypothetical protein